MLRYAIEVNSEEVKKKPERFKAAKLEPIPH